MTRRPVDLGAQLPSLRPALSSSPERPAAGAPFTGSAQGGAQASRPRSAASSSPWISTVGLLGGSLSGQVCTKLLGTLAWF